LTNFFAFFFTATPLLHFDYFSVGPPPQLLQHDSLHHITKLIYLQKITRRYSYYYE